MMRGILELIITCRNIAHDHYQFSLRRELFCDVMGVVAVV